MSESEKTQKNKGLIVAAAIKTLSQKGFAGTTVTLVAQEAGVSRGLLHYHFKNVEELLAEAVYRAFEPMGEVFGQIIDQAQSADQLAQTLAQMVRHAMQTDPDAMALMTEALAVGRHSERVSEKMRQILEDNIAEQEARLHAFFKRTGHQPPVPLRHLPRLLIALLDGVGLQSLFIPEMEQDKDFWTSFERLLAHLLNASPQEAR